MRILCLFSIATPKSLTFLVENGFDFNKLFADGIPFTPGDTIQTDDKNNDNNSNNNNKQKKQNDKKSEKEACQLRALFAALSSSNTSVVLHNGLLDLFFLYRSFVADLPPSIELFARELLQSLAPVIIDTKHTAQTIIDEPKTYLEYCVRRCERRNRVARAQRRQHIRLRFDHPATFADALHHPSNAPSLLDDNVKICGQFRASGYCRKGSACLLSHNVVAIVEAEALTELSLPMAFKYEEKEGENVDTKNDLLQFVMHGGILQNIANEN